jgi:hypothetical protein
MKRNSTFRMFRNWHPDVASLDDASLVQCVPCTMHPLYNTSLVQCVPCTKHPLNDGSCVQCVPCAMRPLYDASLVQHLPGPTPRLYNASLVQSTPCTMSPVYSLSLVWFVISMICPMYDASLIWCVTCMLLPLDDSSLGLGVPKTMCPLRDRRFFLLCSQRPWYSGTFPLVSFQLSIRLWRVFNLDRRFFRPEKWRQFATKQLGTHHSRDASFYGRIISEMHHATDVASQRHTIRFLRDAKFRNASKKNAKQIKFMKQNQTRWDSRSKTRKNTRNETKFNPLRN